MASDMGAPDAERRRPAEADAGPAPWRRRGPYLSERQWGTVREDCGPDGDAGGHRPVHGSQPKFAKDQHWKDLLLFSDYFHGDNGAGLGAAHQTGWTGLVAATATLFHTISAGDRDRGGRECPKPMGAREEPLS
jgi:hypothetical protein